MTSESAIKRSDHAKPEGHDLPMPSADKRQSLPKRGGEGDVVLWVLLLTLLFAGLAVVVFAFIAAWV